MIIRILKEKSIKDFLIASELKKTFMNSADTFKREKKNQKEILIRIKKFQYLNKRTEKKMEKLFFILTFLFLIDAANGIYNIFSSNGWLDSD